MSENFDRAAYVEVLNDYKSQLVQLIAGMLRDQAARENTYDKEDCFKRAASMVEELA